MPKPRDYKREALLESPERKRFRRERNKARRRLLRQLTEKHGKEIAEKMLEGKDVDHKTPLSQGGSNKTSNLRIRNASKNRADKGTIFAGKKTTRPKNPERN